MEKVENSGCERQKEESRSQKNDLPFEKEEEESGKKKEKGRRRLSCVFKTLSKLVVGWLILT